MVLLDIMNKNGYNLIEAAEENDALRLWNAGGKGENMWETGGGRSRKGITGVSISRLH